MRGSAAYFATANTEALAQPFDLVLASSYVPLAELVGLAPSLVRVPRVLYFHENQLAFPSQAPKNERDHHFGFTQMVSALAAQRCVFNSVYNRDSFLDAGADLLRRMPDAVPPDWISRVRARSVVLPVPLSLPDTPPAPAVRHPDGPLLLWNHRWEFDKNPKTCLEGLVALSKSGATFRLALCGLQFSRAPEVFERTRLALAQHTVQWGEASSSRYVELLEEADVVLSTAHQEFFGVSVVEAVHRGARPLVPDRLAYRELWPATFRYRDDHAFVTALATLLAAYDRGEPLRADRRHLTGSYDAEALVPQYRALFEEVASAGIG